MSYKEYILRDFYKGTNMSARVDLPEPQEILIGRNIVLNPGEGYSNRPGFKYVFNGNTILHGKPFTVILDPKGRGYLIFSGPNLYLLSYDFATLDTISSTIKWRGDVDIVTPVIMSNTLYWVTGTKFYSWNLVVGTAITEVVPKEGQSLDHIKLCTLLINRNNYLYAAGSLTEPNLVYFSGLGDATDFPTTNAVKAISNDGDGLVSLIEFLDKLVAMKTFSAYGGSGIIPTSELVWYPMVVHEGTTSPAAFDRVQNSLAYLGMNGVYLLTAVYTDVYSTRNVSNRLNDFISSLKNKRKARVKQYQNKLYILVDTDGDGVNDTILVGHTNLMFNENSKDDNDTGVQIPFTYWDSEGFYPLQLLGNLEGDLMIFHKVGDYVHISKTDEKLARDDFNSKGISVKVKHKIDFSKPMNLKKINSLVLFIKQNITENTTATVDYKVDYVESGQIPVNQADPSAVWGSSKWGEAKWGWIDAVPVEIPIRRGGYVVEITLSHDVIDEPITVYGFGLKFKLKKLKGIKNM